MNLRYPPTGQTRVEDGEVMIATLKRKGWVEFTPEPEPDPAPEVPAEIPLWAFRAMLTVGGYKAQVEALLDALPEPAKTIARTQWEYGNFIVRGHPLIETLGAALGLSSADIDSIFIQAATLQ